MKKCKTPIRYPGGKSRAVNKMYPYYPALQDMTEFREAFLGGGSVAIDITKRLPNMPVWVNDLYFPLYNFWLHLQSDGERMSDVLYDIKSANNDEIKARELFNDAKVRLNEDSTSAFDKAVLFWVINKCSFSGLTESSSFSKAASKSNFSFAGIENLKYYHKLIKNWKITNLSYEQLLTNDSSTFVYLDPPYDIRDSLYGRKGNMHRGFDHDEFARHCNGFRCPILISYNNDAKVIERFPDWNAATFDLTYTMRSVGDYLKEQGGRKELLLANYDLQTTTVC